MSNSQFLPALFEDRTPEERGYFLALAKERDREISLHQTLGGLWDKDEQGRDWSNVTEHCILEIARVRALGGLLGLSSSVIDLLESAAAVHDFYKKTEIRLTREEIAHGGSGRASARLCDEKARELLEREGISKHAISIAGHVSGDPEDIRFLKKISDSDNPDDIERAHLVMHYVDNFTRGSAWSLPREETPFGAINEIDRRSRANAENPHYQKMNVEGVALNEGDPFFQGMTRFQASAAYNHLLEGYFSGIMQKRGLAVADPLMLPEIIDGKIREEIKKRSL